MTEPGIRAEWLAFRESVEVEAVGANQSQGALFRLFDRYRVLSAVQRRVVDTLTSQAVIISDQTERFDAMALIDEFRIESALPALRSMADRLESESRRGAPFEWVKVNRVIAASPRAAGNPRNDQPPPRGTRV